MTTYRTQAELPDYADPKPSVWRRRWALIKNLWSALYWWRVGACFVAFLLCVFVLPKGSSSAAHLSALQLLVLPLGGPPPRQRPRGYMSAP